MQARLVIDVATDRLVFVTTDLDIQLWPAEGTIQVEYEGDLPNDLYPENCWNWTYRNKTITRADNNPRISPSESVVENNRKVLIKMLVDKINEKRKPYASDLLLGDIARDLKMEATPFVQSLADLHGKTMEEFWKVIAQKREEMMEVIRNTEILREGYMIKILAAKDNDTLIDLREEIAEI